MSTPDQLILPNEEPPGTPPPPPIPKADPPFTRVDKRPGAPRPAASQFTRSEFVRPKRASPHAGALALNTAVAPNGMVETALDPAEPDHASAPPEPESRGDGAGHTLPDPQEAPLQVAAAGGNGNDPPAPPPRRAAAEPPEPEKDPSQPSQAATCEEEAKAIREANYAAVLGDPDFDDKNSDEIVREVQRRVTAGIDPRGETLPPPIEDSLPPTVPRGARALPLVRQLDAQLIEEGIDISADNLPLIARDTLQTMRENPGATTVEGLAETLGFTQQDTAEQLEALAKHLFTERLDDLPPTKNPPPLHVPSRYSPSERTALISELDTKLAAIRDTNPTLSPEEVDLASYLPDEDLRELLTMRREGQPDEIIKERFGKQHGSSISAMEARLLDTARRNIPNDLLPRDLPQPGQPVEQASNLFGSALGDLIDSLGITQREAAARIGINKDVLSRVVNGKSLPKYVQVVTKAANSLGATPEETRSLLDMYYRSKAERYRRIKQNKQ
jgi:plasmid maintenance system antidote protein VapI